MKPNSFTVRLLEQRPRCAMRPWASAALLILASHFGSPCSRAVSFVTAPTLTKTSLAPLAALLQVSTDVPSRVTVAVNEGSNTWRRAFCDYNTSHSIPLLGFKPGRTNQVQVTVYDRLHNSATAAEPLTFITSKLPVHPSATSPNATMARIIEHTHEPVPEVVFELSFFDASNTSSAHQGYLCYRSRHIHDLYAHPAAAVTDLTAQSEAGGPFLRFSSDPARAYVIEGSVDLVNWTVVGPPLTTGSDGEFTFKDPDAQRFATRFYRVITQ
jgi:hypothetical protein